MKRVSLIALGVLLAAIASVALASAAAPAKGRLIVATPKLNVGAATSVHLTSILAPNTFRTTIYVPAGYRAPGGVGAVGNNVGKAHVFVDGPNGGRITLNGQLSVVNANEYPQTGCASVTGKHRAVWVVKATQTSGSATATFPIFVDNHQTDPEMPASVAYTLQYCTGGLGMKIDEVDLDLVRMFVNPAARGIKFWRAVYDPATSDGTAIMPGASVLVAAAVPISTHVSLNVTRIKNGPGVVRLRGSVLAARSPLGGVKVHLYVGRSSRLALNRPRTTVRTKADGTYSAIVHLATGTWYVRAKASTPYLDITPGGGCTSLGADHLATKGCVDATLAPFIVVSKPLKRVVR